MFEQRNPFRRSFTGGLALGAFAALPLLAIHAAKNGSMDLHEAAFFVALAIVAGGLTGLVWGAIYVLLYRFVPSRLARQQWIVTLLSLVPVPFLFAIRLGDSVYVVGAGLVTVAAIRWILSKIFPVISRSYAGAAKAWRHALLAIFPMAAGALLQWHTPSSYLDPWLSIIAVVLLYLAGLLEAFYWYRDLMRRKGRWSRGPAILASPPLAAMALVVAGLSAAYARQPWSQPIIAAKAQRRAPSGQGATRRGHPLRRRSIVLITAPSMPIFDGCTPIPVVPTTDATTLVMADAMSVATGCHIPARLLIYPEFAPCCRGIAEALRRRGYTVMEMATQIPERLGFRPHGPIPASTGARLAMARKLIAGLTSPYYLWIHLPQAPTPQALAELRSSSDVLVLYSPAHACIAGARIGGVASGPHVPSYALVGSLMGIRYKWNDFRSTVFPPGGSDPPLVVSFGPDGSLVLKGASAKWRPFARRVRSNVRRCPKAPRSIMRTVLRRVACRGTVLPWERAMVERAKNDRWKGSLGLASPQKDSPAHGCVLTVEDGVPRLVLGKR